MKAKLIISVLAFIALTTMAGAQDKEISSSMPQRGTAKGMNFVDANKNGICDNFENNSANNANCRRYGPNNGCGLGRRQMRGMRNGSGMGRDRSGMNLGKGRFGLGTCNP
jgi:hypothetical protein